MNCLFIVSQMVLGVVFAVLIFTSKATREVTE